MLPLFDGRMIGNGLLGNKTRLLAIQADFHAKVGQVYGLKRGAPAKRYSKAARTSASDEIIGALRRLPNALDDPAIRDALRDVLVESMPVRLMELLGLEVPEVKAQQFKAIVFESKKAIVFDDINSAPKDQTLSCVVFGVSAPVISPAALPMTSDSEYIRERESEMPTSNFIDGKFIKSPIRHKRHSDENMQIRKVIEFMVNKATGELRP